MVKRTVLTALFLVFSFGLFVPKIHAVLFDVCQDYAPGNTDCHNCMKDGLGSWTAFGCVPAVLAGQSTLFDKIMLIGTGIGSGVAFILILIGGFQILTSAGDPEKLTAGREMVTSAITGLLVIIFSVFILKVIGINIFGIPGFL